ncbi:MULTISPECIES: hypothetical protein [unclassified Rickettsia]|uniref:hypothetical protein n=1 Tax=unclassified Rickettsia TaxID=114295 RepID=UPI003132C921
MRDLIRMLNLFSIKIYLTGLPRRDYVPPRNDDVSVTISIPSTIPYHNDSLNKSLT